ncbi:CheR family methyltransferase [Donghicola eburneus]|uniref:CheR family methyltransferase n=1 Tax=Donghicola eburneus TaxID=393278 RepID=UPI0015A5BDB7|nr:CheR family methyltransferase [Donghicola eburneus]
MVKIVAIGTSAGGLSALETFFAATQHPSDMCYVVVQHLSPDFVSMMDRLLARISTLDIRKIEDGDPILANTIYLNTPSTYIEVEDDRFRVRPFDRAGRAPRLPIDHFFSSLAQSAYQPVAAVVMTGSASDGAQGALKITQAGGLAFAQDPEESEFPTMPEALIKAIPSAEVATAGELPALIHARLSGATRAPVAWSELSAYQGIIRLLQDTFGFEADDYKPDNVRRRVERRMALNGFNDERDYLDLLAQSREALEELYGDVLIGVTRFYRDIGYFHALRKDVFPEMLHGANEETPLRIWVAACSTGEEAYTLAIELSEAMEEVGLPANFRILATDVYAPAIKTASAGIYQEQQVQHIAPDLLQKYFYRSGRGYQVKSQLRQKLIFSVQNAQADAPFLRLDLVSCRNMLIYLTDEAQAKTLANFNFGLKQGGYLTLGPSETPGALLDQYSAVNEKWRVYHKHPAMLHTGHAPADREGPLAMTTEDPKPNIAPNLNSDSRDTRESAARSQTARDGWIAFKTYEGLDAMLRRYAPSSILINADGEVLTWYGLAGLYVDTKGKTGGWHVEDVLHPGMRTVIADALMAIREKKIEVTEHEIDLQLTETDNHRVAVKVEPLALTPPYARFVVVGLRRVSDDEQAVPNAAGEEDAAKLRARVAELDKDLRLTEESLQYVIEAMESNADLLRASNEELRFANEELQTSNEELQAANKELHAVNEELQIVTSDFERQVKSEAEQISAYESALQMAGLSALFLDAEMRLEAFTQGAGRLLELVRSDRGRTIRSVGITLPFADWAELCDQVRTTGREAKVEGELDGSPLAVKVRYIKANEISDKALFAVLLQET